MPWLPETPPDFPKRLQPAVVRWVLPGWYIPYQVGAAVVAGRIYYIPIFVTEATTYIRIGGNVSALSAGSADCRIFKWNNGLPGSLILSAGTFDTGTTGLKEIVISQLLARDYYFLAVRYTGTPTMYGADPFYAIVTPVPGCRETGTVTPNKLVLYVDAVYADPAPAPTDGTYSTYVSILLREN